MLQDTRHEACGRGLTVCAADRDRPAQTHQFCQHFRTTNDRDQLCPRRNNLRVVFLDGGRGHDNLGVTQIGGIMSDVDLDASVSQTLNIRAFRNI